MQSKISFFNKTVFKNNTSRFWPSWVLYFVILLFVFPISCLSSMRYDYYADASALSVAAEFLNISTIRGMLFIAVAFSILFAMELYSYLYTTKSAGMVGSFPVKRREMFFTCYLTGIIWMVVSNVIIGGLLALTLMIAGKLIFTYVVMLFGIITLMEVFFFSLATFCAALTGNIVVLPLAFIGANFIFAAFEGIIKTLSMTLIFGYSASSNFATTFLTPIVKYYSGSFSIVDAAGKAYSRADTYMANVEAAIKYDQWGYLIGSVLVGFALVAVAVFIIRYRHYETAGDIISVRCLRPLFKIVVSIFCAMGLGYAVYFIIFMGSSTILIIPFALIMGVCAIIGYFAADMLVQKNFRVFKNWVPPVICALLVVLVVFGINADVFGIASKVPDADDVASVKLYSTNDVEFTSKEKIQDVIDLHKSILDDQDRIEDRIASGREGGTYLQLEYYDKDGDLILGREYWLPVSDNGQAKYISKLEELYNSSEAKENIYHLSNSTLESVYIEYSSISSGEYAYLDTEAITTEVAKELFDAAKEDIRNGDLGKFTIVEGEKKGVSVCFSVSFVDKDGVIENDDFYFIVDESAKKTAAVLSGLGIDFSDVQTVFYD